MEGRRELEEMREAFLLGFSFLLIFFLIFFVIFFEIFSLFFFFVLRCLIARLITSDCARNIFWWEAVEGGWTVDMQPYCEHTGSVEDLQWSPSEADVW
jgi:hypothetical protein